jgi:hypothetical protein
MVATLGNAGSQHVPFVAQPFFAASDGHAQGRHIRAANVAQFDPLEVIPAPLGRVQFGCIARQLLQVQASSSATAQEVLNRLAPMNGGPRPR